MPQHTLANIPPEQPTVVWNGGTWTCELLHKHGLLPFSSNENCFGLVCDRGNDRLIAIDFRRSQSQVRPPQTLLRGNLCSVCKTHYGHLCSAEVFLVRTESRDVGKCW